MEGEIQEQQFPRLSDVFNWQDKTKLKISRVGEQESKTSGNLEYKKFGGRRVLVGPKSDGGEVGATIL